MARIGLVGCLIAVILVVIILGAYVISVRNNFVGLDQGVQSQWAQVENVYQRRYDLVPNLVRTVQGAANFEKSTLQAVVEARSRVGLVQAPAGAPGAVAGATPNDPQRFAQFEQAQAGLSSALSRLLVVVERYPELKATQNFLELQSQLEGTENRIAVERKRYNEVAQQFNTAVIRFPANVVANMFDFKPKQYFKSTAGAERAPEVRFDFGTGTGTAAPATTGTR
jgi:LemA protein